MTNMMGLIIEMLVAILLAITIGYCMMLNRRLKLLKADEGALRATIGELVTATEIAERAIGGLKLTARDCDAGLGQRLRHAERLCSQLDDRLAGGKALLAQLPPAAPGERHGQQPIAPLQDAHAIAVAAEAFGERLRSRVFGLAA